MSDGNLQADASTKKIRLATAWLGGCSGCHMSFLDLDELLFALAEKVEVVYSPIVDLKAYPENVDVAIIEGAVANFDNLEILHKIRQNTKIIVSFGDCAVTGNVTSLRNRLGVDDLLTKVYHEGPGKHPVGGEKDRVMPRLLDKVLPIHQVVKVDIFLPGCPPEPDRIWKAVSSLLAGQTPDLEPKERTFG